MKQLISIVFSISFSLSVFCQKNTENYLVGDWYLYNELSFTLDKDYNFQSYNNGKIFFSGKYELLNDSLLFTSEGSLVIKYNFKYFNDSLFLCNNKTPSGPLKDHIDEINIFTRTKKESNQVNKAIKLKSEKFILPDNFYGEFHVNYNQASGQLKKLDDLNNRLIYIENDGLTKTQFKVDPLNYALEKMVFFQNGCIISFFISDRIMNLNETELKTLGYSLDSIYVCVYGFNQIGRKEINKIFNQKIEGNVLTMKIDTLKNLLPTLKHY